MKTFFIVLTFVLSLQCWSQTDSTKVIAETDSVPIFMNVVIVASIDRETWTNYLENAVKPYIDSVRENGIRPGTYSVPVQFVVDADGSIIDPVAMSNPGYGLAGSAVKIMLQSPKWNPSIENGKRVRSKRTQVITFVVPKQKSGKKKG